MFQDVRFALRSLRKSAGFSLVAILSLALGIGANSAIFSLANGILLRPMPVPHPSRIIVVQSQLRGESLGGLFQYSGMSYPDFEDLRGRSRSFAALAASDYSPFGFAVDQRSAPQMKFGALVSGDFFRVLEVKPCLGRDFRRDEDQAAGRDAVTVLGYQFWQSEFGGSPDVIGKSILLNGVAFTIIGVAPESFTGPDSFVRAQLYVPLAMAPRLSAEGGKSLLEERGKREMSIYGRLQPGVSVRQAAAETEVIGRQLADAYPATNRTCRLVASTELLSRLRSTPADAVLVALLLAMAGVVLLIACANVMNLMLSRGRARAREIAVRLAIGAGRGRLVRQLLTESLIIALMGGALGLIIAQAGADLFSQIRIPTDIPVVLNFGLDPAVLLFTVFASAVSAILFGLAPALQSTRPELSPALKYGRLDDTRRGRFLGRNALVIGQVAGSLVLLAFATQAYRGASIVLSSRIGFRTDHLLTATFDPSLARSTAAQTRDFYKRLLERVRTLTGVRNAALAQAAPFLPGIGQNRVVPEGVHLPPGTEAVGVLSNTVSEEYFDTFDIPIMKGRPFQETDRADTPRVAIVNELFARKYYPNQDAVGRRFRLDSPTGPLVQIVGVAKQSKYAFPVEPPFDFLYLPLSQNPQTGMTLVLHSAIAPAELAGPLRALVRSLDPGQPVIGVRSMSEIFEQRARGTLNVLIEAVTGLGLLGLVLALVGLYGLMTYSVGLRQREIGIRMAIGADRAGVLRLILQQGLGLAGGGIAIGVLLWLAASRPVMTLIQARSFSWSLLAVVALGLLAAAALGAYIPARRASRVDPNAVLRQE